MLTKQETYQVFKTSTSLYFLSLLSSSFISSALSPIIAGVTEIQSHPLLKRDKPLEPWKQHVFLGMVLAVWRAAIPSPAPFPFHISSWEQGHTGGQMDMLRVHSLVTFRSPWLDQALKCCNCPQCGQSTGHLDENSWEPKLCLQRIHVIWRDVLRTFHTLYGRVWVSFWL